jgi:hypothetical protein
MSTLKLNAAKAGPIIDQLKACGDGLAACGDLHAGALVHALHSHLTNVYKSGDYLTAAVDPNAPGGATLTHLQAMRIKDSAFDSMLKRTGIDTPLHFHVIDQKLEAAGISGRQATEAKIKLNQAGLVIR